MRRPPKAPLLFKGTVPNKFCVHRNNVSAMPLAKRTRSYSSRVRKAFKRPTKWALRQYKRPRVSGQYLAVTALKGVKRLTRMIETKEGSRRSFPDIAIAHNNIYVVVDRNSGTYLNPFNLNSGTADDMSTGGQRVGDSISVKGLMIRAFLENALSRPKVWWRMMLVKCSKGDLPTRATLFKNDSDNKMIDQVNTERYTIVTQKTFNIQTANTAPTGVAVTGVPTGETGGGQGNRIVKMWVPGSKFGRSGDLQYENGATQLKFFDYYIVFCCYDWYGTPQDVNNVGKINELYTKLYFKDA